MGDITDIRDAYDIVSESAYGNQQWLFIGTKKPVKKYFTNKEMSKLRFKTDNPDKQKNLKFVGRLKDGWIRMEDSSGVSIDYSPNSTFEIE